MTLYCFYHSADFDGQCSAAIVKYKYPEAKFCPINHGQDFPWDMIKEGDEDEVIMVDYSLQPFEDMVRLSRICKLTWIDHHASAIRDWEEEDYATDFYDVRVGEGKAACEHCWEYFFPDEEMPNVVKWLGRYDVWDLEDELVLKFQYGMRGRHFMRKPDHPTWKALFKEGDDPYTWANQFMAETLCEGAKLWDYQRGLNKQLIRCAGYELEWEGKTWAAVNGGPGFNSLLFNGFYDPEKHFGMLLYYYAGDSGFWRITLYTSNDRDVSVIAKKNGGGGHPYAAGCQCKTLPWLE